MYYDDDDDDDWQLLCRQHSIVNIITYNVTQLQNMHRHSSEPYGDDSEHAHTEDTTRMCNKLQCDMKMSISTDLQHKVQCVFQYAV